MVKKIALVIGIRPDLIKMVEIIKLLDKEDSIDLKFIWSGQHYSDNLKDVFFKNLEVRAPDIELGAKGDTDGELLGDIIKKLHATLKDLNPDALLFIGDTNTVAGCIAAVQLNIPLLHVEGCMRSYDWRMLEEKYRVMIDHLADVIYTYLPAYRERGLKEGLNSDRIVLMGGNPLVDVLQKYRDPNFISEVLKEKGLLNKEFILMTSHRRENVDFERPLKNIFKLCSSINKTILFPIGYRTQKSIKEFNIEVPENMILIDPIGYKDFISFMGQCHYIITDSGTVVEEASILGKPTIQMRRSTERPELYDLGISLKFDPSKTYSQEEMQSMVEQVEALIGKEWTHPYGDGKASERVVQDIVRRANSQEGFRTHNSSMEDLKVE
jgi:UDP-N-acetylglucosamine 2-epimerase (non-hydrolysing)